MEVLKKIFEWFKKKISSKSKTINVENKILSDIKSENGNVNMSNISINQNNQEIKNDR